AAAFGWLLLVSSPPMTFPGSSPAGQYGPWCDGGGIPCLGSGDGSTGSVTASGGSGSVHPDGYGWWHRGTARRRRDMDWVAGIDSAGVRYPRRKRSPDAQVMTAGVCPECGSDAESGHVVAIGPRIYWSTRGILGRALG